MLKMIVIGMLGISILAVGCANQTHVSQAKTLRLSGFTIHIVNDGFQLPETKKRCAKPPIEDKQTLWVVGTPTMDGRIAINEACLGRMVLEQLQDLP